MQNSRLLIIAEQESVILPYKVLLGEFFTAIDTIVLQDNLPKIDSSKYVIVLIDLLSKRFIGSLKMLSSLESRVVLITPFNFSDVSNFNALVGIVSLSLTKPIDVKKLIQYVQNENYKFYRSMILERKNHILAKVIDLHPARIGVFDLQGLLFYANENYLKANKLKLEDIDKLNFDNMAQCDDLGFENIKEKLQRVQSFSTQKQNENLWFESVFYIVDHDFIIHICTDITLQKQKEINLEQAAVFYENSNEGIVITDLQGKIITVNRAFCKITGFTKDEVIGKKTSILNSGMHDKNFYEMMWDSLKNNDAWQGEVWNKRKNGEIYPEWLSISKASNSKYNEEFYIAIFTDITTLKEADKKLYYYANHDILTGLANRVQFESNLKMTIELCKRRKIKAGLMFIDLDKFKEVNDTFGHSIGDTMLITVAKKIEQTIRKEDFIARIGGDEFVLIIKDIKLDEDLAKLAQKINEKIKEPITIGEKVFFMSLSIGIAIYPDHALESEDLVKYADAAMYEVKEQGRDGYSIYNQGMTQKVAQKMSLQNELKFALEQDQFEMYYQAIVNINSNKIIGAEALVRWNHSSKGVLAPNSFIDFMEQSNMNLLFGDMVIKKVFYDIHVINSAMHHNHFKLSINISAKQFFDYNFVPNLLKFTKDFAIDSKQIELELLETQIMNNSEISTKKIDQLHQNGFSISIDDFGTGYSSLSYLKNFKVDKLKIDQSFIRDFIDDKSDRVIVQAIIKLAETFNLKVQAEGVETAEHFTLLQTMECDYAQGYTFNKPMPLSEFLGFVKEYNHEK